MTFDLFFNGFLEHETTTALGTCPSSSTMNIERLKFTGTDVNLVELAWAAHPDISTTNCRNLNPE